MPLNRSAQLMRWFFSPFYGQERSYWRAVTACFLAASTFWLLNALNKTYTTRIAYPLAWRYDATRYVPVQPLPTEVAVNVTTRGWKLLRKHLMLDMKPAEITLPGLPATRYVTGRVVRPALQASMEGLQFNYLISDTLWVAFDRLLSRRLPLALSPAADGSALPFAARFTPASVVFQGPARQVLALSNPYPVHLPRAPASSSNGDMSVPIGGPDLVKTSVPEVRVRLQPRPLVSVLMRVVPELSGFPAGREYQLRPATVQVRLQCFPEDSARLSQQRSQVRVQLHYGQFAGPDSSLQPVLAQVPALVRGRRVITPTVRVSVNGDDEVMK
ncbi:hypothetical protein [Hymenobacter sp. APR13]|uniref:hypothetical protein n=1 Tax=Hymenobacter sp. APR13 TaxID=1356852 RepID=UPI0004E090B2|nr:hypothetical protein [Hymenobacter sp. APR13]AII51866.1 hypothetical protein N008_07705 [Hymenobacter sp. APR13]